MFSFRKDILVALSLLCLAFSGETDAQDPEPHPWDIGDDILRRDTRLQAARHTNTRFEMTEFGSLEAWRNYAETLRFRIRFASGLWPEPARTPLNARVFDPIEREHYTIYKVHFEAYPGFLVTGNLYKPKGEGPFPGVLNPHGHWEHGRFENTGTTSVPARCITFARMGMVAFTYDMVGYNDSKQFPKAWGHDWEAIPIGQRREQALWGLHPFGVQLWSAIRGLDFLESLPYVDADRLACTGASGGGTQTFALYAVDDRVKVAAPVNMISHSMQGGDACENAPLIRHDATNMEIGALMAPRPLLMVSATGDWTRDTPKVEYPAIRGVYELYGAGDRIENLHIDAGHNYNQASREAVYRFFGKFLLGEEEKYANFTEPPYEMEPAEKLRVFPGTLPRTYSGGDDLVTALIREARDRANTLAGGAVDRDRYRQALRMAIGVNRAAAITKADIYRVAQWSQAETSIEKVALHSTDGEVVPVIALASGESGRNHPVLFVPPDGARSMVSPDGVPRGDIANALADGHPVGVVTVFGSGEREAQRIRRPPFPDTFSRSVDANRVRDILLAAQWLFDTSDGKPVELRGIGEAMSWCVLAVAARPDIARTAAELAALPGVPSDADDLPAIPLIGMLGGPAQVAAALGEGSILLKLPETSRVAREPHE